MRTPVLTLSDGTTNMVSRHPKQYFYSDPRMQHWFRYELFLSWCLCTKGGRPTDQEESDWHNMMSGCEL